MAAASSSAGGNNPPSAGAPEPGATLSAIREMVQAQVPQSAERDRVLDALTQLAGGNNPPSSAMPTGDQTFYPRVPAGAAEPGGQGIRAAGLNPEVQQAAASSSCSPPQPTVTDAPADAQTDPAAGAQEPGMGSLVQILFRPADMDHWRAQGAQSGWDWLHKGARQELEHRIHIGPDIESDPAMRFSWQSYVAMHPQANDLVGPGITAFEANFIAGTTDPNRRGQPRLDFVIRHTDGGYWRLHPGSKPSGDAVPRYFAPEIARTHSAADQWRYLPPQGFTMEDARSVPQIDRRGKKEAWAALENLPLGELDSSPDATFKWWLWLANLGPYTERILGAGVVKAEMTCSNPREKTIVCSRADFTAVEIQFSCAKGIKVKEL